MKKQQRPPLVTIVCVLAFIGLIVNFPSIFSPFIKAVGTWYPALYGSILAIHFISIVGVWYMKKWGVYFYFITTLMNQLAKITINDWKAISLILPFIFLLSVVFYYPKMEDNL